MDPFLTLQSIAAQKRDEAIAGARRQYRQDIEAIDALQRSLPSPLPTIDQARPLKQQPTVTDIIRAVVPRDKPFTVSDVMHLLHDAHQGQKFHYPTVRTQTSRLCSRGYLKRLYKTGHQETMYALATSAVDDGPIDTKSLPEVTEEILREAGRPLKVVEIAVAMRERGYRSNNVPNTLMRAIRDMFKRYPGRFQVGKDGRWAATDHQSHFA